LFLLRKNNNKHACAKHKIITLWVIMVSLLFPEGKQSETIRNNQAHLKSSILTAVQIFDLKSMQGKELTLKINLEQAYGLLKKCKKIKRDCFIKSNFLLAFVFTFK